MSSAVEVMDADPFKRAKDEETDLCGTGGRAKRPLLRLSTSQGVFWIPNHCIVGIDELIDSFVIHLRATLGWPVKGKLVAMEGCWKATIVGKRLESLVVAVGSGTRWTLNNGGTSSDKGPYVSSIEIEPVETVAFEAPVSGA